MTAENYHGKFQILYFGDLEGKRTMLGERRVQPVIGNQPGSDRWVQLAYNN